MKFFRRKITNFIRAASIYAYFFSISGLSRIFHFIPGRIGIHGQ